MRFQDRLPGKPAMTLVAGLLFIAGNCLSQAIENEAIHPRSLLDLKPAQIKACKEWLKTKGRPPLDFLVEKFRHHDLVMVGETHMVLENCRFVASTLERLSKAGIHVLATEFVRSRNNKLLRTLLSGKEFDNRLGLKIMRDLPWPTWGFQDYLDILKAAWKVNRNRPAGTPPFTVIGIDSDWTQYDLWFKAGRAESFKIRLSREKHMISTVEKEILGKHCKALLHTGRDHTFKCQGIRLGTVLSKKYGARIFQAVLHFPITIGRRRAFFTKWLEALLRTNGGEPIGFDVAHSPFEGIFEKKADLFRFLPKGYFSGLAEGYIFLKPIDKLHKATWIPDFITNENFAKALAIAKRMGYVKKGEKCTLAELNLRMAKFFNSSVPAFK